MPKKGRTTGKSLFAKEWHFYTKYPKTKVQWRLKAYRYLGFQCVRFKRMGNDIKKISRQQWLKYPQPSFVERVHDP